MPSNDSSIVKTTVHKDQKDQWVAHADELDMTQSEFVRTMVQAGRRGFELEPPESPSEHVPPRVDGLKKRILDALSEDDHVSFDEIVATLTEDIESQVDEILQSLRDTGRIRHSNVEGGYVLTGGSHGDD